MERICLTAALMVREVASCYVRAWSGRTCPAAFVIVGAPFQRKILQLSGRPLTIYHSLYDVYYRSLTNWAVGITREWRRIGCSITKGTHDTRTVNWSVKRKKRGRVLFKQHCGTLARTAGRELPVPFLTRQPLNPPSLTSTPIPCRRWQPPRRQAGIATCGAAPCA